MKLFKLRYLLGTLITLALLVTVVGAVSNETISVLLNRMLTVKYNSAEQSMKDANGEPVYPISYNGTTYLPIRAICDMLGVDIEWDEPTNTVSISERSSLRERRLIFTECDFTGGYCEAFDITLALPDGWTIKTIADKDLTQSQKLYMYGNESEKRYIYDDSGECVGAIGYNAYSLNEGVAESNKSVYWEVAIPTMYSFDIYEKYDVVKSSDNGETALTVVRYSKSFLSTWYPDAESEKINRGILSYDRSRSAYIMIELESDLVDEKLAKEIAQSIEFSASDDAVEDTFLKLAEEYTLNRIPEVQRQQEYWHQRLGADNSSDPAPEIISARVETFDHLVSYKGYQVYKYNGSFLSNAPEKIFCVDEWTMGDDGWYIDLRPQYMIFNDGDSPTLAGVMLCEFTPTGYSEAFYSDLDQWIADFEKSSK